ncbi:hypothetical protein JCM11641_002405 [Rhodosporidiobolus odoratus]
MDKENTQSPVSAATASTTSEPRRAGAVPTSSDVGSAASTSHKRPRAAVDPGTPRGEGEENKGVGMTPLAKKGRTEDDPSNEEQAASDSERATPPRATGPSGESRPSTPAQAGTAPAVPGTEGKDTRKLRERVAAMKPPGQDAEGLDTPEQKQDTVIADVAAEVSGSAANLADQQEEKEEKDAEIAEVAAEVGKSAEKVDEPVAGKEEKMGEGEKEAAQTAAEVGDSAAAVQAKDEKVADAAAEVADAAKAAPEPTPAPTPKSSAAQPTFASYSSTASPFAAYSSAASPLASVTTPSQAVAPFEGKTPKVPKAEVKKPFAASSFLSSSIPLAVPAASSSASSAAPKPVVAETPATPSFTKSAPTTNLAAASPFSAFASTSGFASASKPPGASSAFSAFSAASSAFSSVPSTPLKASSKSALDEAKESSASTAAEGTAGTEQEESEKKPVYTEQERFTGEEEEEVLYQVRCKVFVMEEGQWKERGTGPLRVNQSRRADEGEKGGARLVMRADATHRLLLNAPLFKEFSIEVSNEKYVRFTVLQGADPISYMLRTGNPNAAQTLVEAVRDKVATL